MNYWGKLGRYILSTPPWNTLPPELKALVYDRVLGSVIARERRKREFAAMLEKHRKWRER